MACEISKQIAEHCDDEEKLCECGEPLQEKSAPFMGTWKECPKCGWHNFKDE